MATKTHWQYICREHFIVFESQIECITEYDVHRFSKAKEAVQFMQEKGVEVADMVMDDKKVSQFIFKNYPELSGWI